MRLIVLMLIVVAGLGLRLESAWHGSEANLPDSVAYERIARGLAEHDHFVQSGPGLPAGHQRASNYSPGLPVLIAGIFKLSGRDDARLVRMLLALVAAAAIPLTWQLGRRLGGEAAGLCAAAIIAFYPTLIGDAGMLLTEPLAGTLILAAVLLLLRARERGTVRSWILPGLLLGLTTMVRPEYLAISVLLGAAVALFVLVGSRHYGALVPVAVMVTSALVVLLPWSVVNTIELGRLVPLSTGGGQALFTGSYMPSGGDPQLVVPHLLEEQPGLTAALDDGSGRGFAPDHVFELMAARAHPTLDTDTALALMARRRYIDEARRDPLGLSAFLIRKAQRIWWRGRATLTGKLPGKLLHWLIASLSLIGLAGLIGSRRFEFTVIATLLLGATAVGVILVASPRRALVLWPVIASLAGVGIAMAAPVLIRIPGYRGRRIAIP